MQVTIFIKECKEQIDVLRAGISNDEANSKGWLGIRGDSSNTDTVAHKHGVVCSQPYQYKNLLICSAYATCH